MVCQFGYLQHVTPRTTVRVWRFDVMTQGGKPGALAGAGRRQAREATARRQQRSIGTRIGTQLLGTKRYSEGQRL
jgi:hypothetical protein